MASEWMLWAKRLKNEHKVLLSRLDTTEKATAQTRPLSEQIKDLVSAHQSIKERLLRLEEQMADKEKTAGTDVTKLKRMVGELEKEVVSVVGDLKDWKKELAQVLHKGTGPKPRSKGFLPISVGVGARRLRNVASNPLSQATTRESSLSAPRDSVVEIRRHPRDSIGLTAQGESTLEEYLAYGESAVQRALQMYETRAVKAFVSGIRENYQQEMLWETLDEEGWSWQNARRVLRKIPSEDRRGRKRRREAINPPTNKS